MSSGRRPTLSRCRVKEAGYATAMFGKWHLGHHKRFLPTRHGVDRFYGIPYSNDMWPHHPENPEAWVDLPTIDGEKAVGHNTDQSRFTTDFTDRAVAFIDDCANADTPFFLYVAHPMPHVPLHVSDKFAGATRAGVYGDAVQLRELPKTGGNQLQFLFSVTTLLSERLKRYHQCNQREHKALVVDAVTELRCFKRVSINRVCVKNIDAHTNQWPNYC